MISFNFQSGYPSQTSNFAIGANTYTIRIRWNQRFSFWSMSLYLRESEPLICGIRLVENTPLIGFLNLSEFDGDFFFVPTYSNSQPPDFNAIGGDFSLIYLTRSDMDELVSASS